MKLTPKINQVPILDLSNYEISKIHPKGVGAINT